MKITDELDMYFEQAGHQMSGDFHERATVNLHILAKRLLLEDGLEKHSLELSFWREVNPKLIGLLESNN